MRKEKRKQDEIDVIKELRRYSRKLAGVQKQIRRRWISWKPAGVWHWEKRKKRKILLDVSYPLSYLGK